MCVREVKILTGITGYINHYAGIAARPNCQLVWHPHHGLGQHSLALKVIQAIPKAKELSINYGTLHAMSLPREVRDRRRGGRPAAMAKRARQTAGG